MTARCEKTDLLIDACGHCTGAEEQAMRETAAGLGIWFEARHESECSGDCGEDIRPGDMIRGDGRGGWLCQGCGHG